jgi:hypothetical protein
VRHETTCQVVHLIVSINLQLWPPFDPALKLTCAHDKSRDGLGVAMEGQRAMQSLINIHFSSPALAAR